MEAKKKMDIHITMGKADGHQFLTEMNATITTDPNLVIIYVTKASAYGPVITIQVRHRG